MKIKSPEARSQKPEARSWTSAEGLRVSNLQPSRRGIALVITLILLSVTLIMAVAFLAVARRERNAVTTTTDTDTARLAADTALAAAQAQIAANLLSTNAGGYDYNLLVSTNYITPGGIIPNTATLGYISYYDTNGNFLTGNNLEQAVANLYYLPRAPVFIRTNAGSPLDFRFYLDLNRNGQFEANGLVPDVEYQDGVLVTNASPVSEVGDPEWVGVLEHPDQPHGPSNRFIARYAFFAQPAGNSLDLNAIHNQTLGLGPNVSLANPDYYFRNEGVGSWELNLAAFLADLNTNEWNPPAGNYYGYLQPYAANVGVAFEDARSLLSWRYGFSYNSLAIPPANPNLYSVLADAGVDGFTVGSMSPFNQHWAGSDNTNRFFALASDLFDKSKTQPTIVAPQQGFSDRLAGTGTNMSTYDRYTFYRMLDELGTDSGSDDARMNLNYRNVTNGMVVPGMETNCLAWAPLDFFTNAADRMLRYYTANWLAANTNFFTNTFGVDTTNAFGVANIPVYVDGQFVYSPAVNRILQLAANMYDASTNQTAALGKDYPSVFRPVFTVVPDGIYRNLYITGYTNVDSVGGPDDVNYFLPPADALAVASANLGSVAPAVNVYGVPWIIGAKKWLPNFNQFYMLNAVEVTRKLQITRPARTAADPAPGLNEYATNQMYVFSISNSLGCSLWNSYTNPYSGDLTLVARDNITMVLTNDAAGVVAQTPPLYLVTNAVYTSGTNWPGTVWAGTPPVTALDAQNNSFIIPFNTSVVLLTNSIYRYGGYGGAVPVASPGFDPFNTDYQTNVYAPALPQFGLLTTNRLQVFILDGGHVIDYVHFAGPEGSRNLNAELASMDTAINNAGLFLWDTNPVTAGNPDGTPLGVVNQIIVSRGQNTPMNLNNNFWQPPANLPAGMPQTTQSEIDFFNGFFNVNRLQYGVFVSGGKRYTNAATAVQAPYTPTRMVYDYTSWQANDPLVHYLASDLTYSDPGTTGIQISDNPAAAFSSLGINLNGVSKRWSPWGMPYPFASGADSDLTAQTLYLTQLKDSLAWRPDNWDFPAYKFPTVGWLGRVHRGTPWQTVYLKSSDITVAKDAAGNSGQASWAQWTGDTQTINGQFYDANNSAPVQDAGLFDLFSTSLNDNATRGTLSVNQTHLAAWSAVFSGLVALSNAAPDVIGYVAAPVMTNVIVQPAGVDAADSALWNIVTNINTTRANLVHADGVAGVFEHVGNILRAPALTEQSPFLNWSDTAQRQNGISDELYEWLPQQTLGLLRAGSTPRYVVYCYGQTLRPAPDGIVTDSGPFFGMCTNYQITAESAARAVIRVDKHVTATGTNYTTVIESFNVLPPN